MSGRKIAAQCPVCTTELRITRLCCDHCSTTIDTSVEVPTFFQLPPDLQDFVLVFLRCRGNIKEAEKQLGVSYPTICKRLDQVNKILSGESSTQADRMEILARLERGEINAKEAAKLLRGDYGQ